MKNLPEILGLTRITDAGWHALGERLRRAGFDALYLPQSLQRTMRAYPTSLQFPILTWQMRKRDDPLGYAFRIFMLRDPVPEAKAEYLLGKNLLHDLLDAKLLCHSRPNEVVSLFDLRVYRGLLILCDDLSHRGEAVFGAGPGTAVFCAPASSRRSKTSSGLDLGCGAGAVALWLSRFTDRVVGTDINPRALAFVNINAALNNIANVEVRLGNLFEPVATDLFDLIVSQPPCIPAAAGLDPATYLFGGPAGQEIILEVLSQIPMHLTRGGRAMVVFEEPRMANSEISSCLAHFAKRVNTLLLVGEEVNADSYSIRHSTPEIRGGIEAFDRTAMNMRLHLDRTEILGLSPAVCVMENSSRSEGWCERVQAEGTLWDEISPSTIDSLMAGYDYLHHDEMVTQPVKIRIPSGTLYIRSAAPQGDDSDNVYLGLPPGMTRRTLELTHSEWDCLQAMDRGEHPDISIELATKVVRTGLYRCPD